MATTVLDRPRPSLDDTGLPPLPPGPSGDREPSRPGAPVEPRLLWLILWTVLLVFALPLAWAIEVMISNAS